MAIVGVGIDVVSIPDFAEQVDQPGTVFAATFTGAYLSADSEHWRLLHATLGYAFGGLLVAVSLQGFEDALREIPVLALFMPVVAGMGGNVGTQSSTIVVRGLAVGYVEANALGRLVARRTADLRRTATPVVDTIVDTATIEQATIDERYAHKSIIDVVHRLDRSEAAILDRRRRIADEHATVSARAPAR